MSITSAMLHWGHGLVNVQCPDVVVSNNLANVNTVGYKNSRSQFCDLLSAKEGGILIGPAACAWLRRNHLLPKAFSKQRQRV